MVKKDIKEFQNNGDTLEKSGSDEIQCRNDLLMFRGHCAVKK